MASWDRRSAKANTSLRNQLVRQQVRAVAADAPYWKQRLAVVGRAPDSIDSVAALESLPAVGERDVSPTGDPAAMAGLVVRAGERHFTLHAEGPQLRRALRLRATNSQMYRRLVATETRPTTYLWSGLGFRYPLAATRGDVDVVARAGARLFKVLGITAADSLLSALPIGPTVEHTGLHYAALASGVPAVFATDDVGEIVSTATLIPPTVLAVGVDDAVDIVAALGESNTALATLRTLLVVGAPSDEERTSIKSALAAAGASDVVLLAVHAPSGARLLWGECRESAGGTGLHTYPDLDVVQLLDPDTGEPATGGGEAELVLTQLSMRGSALLRWRTGDLVSSVTDAACPACGRMVPRVIGTRRGALVVATGSGRRLDLRALSGALSGRADIADWRVVVRHRGRDGALQVVVHIGTQADPGEAAVAAAADIRALAGLLPSQLVATGVDELSGVTGEQLTRRVLLA